MNKKVISIVAIIALVAILGVCLVACNADSYAKKLEKAGYTVGKMTDEETAAFAEKYNLDTEIVWAVGGTKGKDNVTILAFADKDDAESFGALLKLVASNADSYAKKLEKVGYMVEKVTGEDAEAEAEGVKWVVMGAKVDGINARMVSVLGFDNADDAKAYADVTADRVGKNCVYVSGKVVIVGSAAYAVKDVKAYTDTVTGLTVHVSGKVVIVGSSADAVKDAK